MKRLCYLLLVSTLILFAERGHGQIEVELVAKETTFLLYEPAFFDVRITNITQEPIRFGNTDDSGKSWLDFMIRRSSGTKVAREYPLEVGIQIIEPGQTVDIPVNITPHYMIRKTDQYRIQAVVDLPGIGSFVTLPLEFHVGNGTIVWSKTVQVQGVERAYSLIRFMRKRSSFLYLRVEEPNQNLVYSTVALGPLVSFTDPMVEFGKDMDIHILHSVGTKTYRYTHTTPDGNIISADTDDRSVTRTAPTLLRDDEGNVIVAGGVSLSEKPEREGLSKLQGGPNS